jgi:phenylacetate-CoA ligase
VKPRERSVCACGRHELALEGGILGRSDDMVVVRGINVYPGLIEEIVRAHPEVTEYRVQIDCRPAMAEMTLEFEAPSDCADPQFVVECLEQSLRNALTLRIPVRRLPPNSLPRFEMKSQRWVKITESA